MNEQTKNNNLTQNEKKQTEKKMLKFINKNNT